MRDISIKGLIIAIIVVLLLDILSGVGLTFALGGFANADRMAPQELDEALKALAVSTNYLVGSMILGTLTTVLGGFISARYGKSAPFTNATVFGVLGILIGMLLQQDLPMWFNILGYAVVIPAALLGAHLAGRGKQGVA